MEITPGSMLFAKCEDGRRHLVDNGSKVAMKAGSSYLGELDTIVWACKRRRVYRGRLPLTIRSHDYGVVDESRASEVYDQNIRSFRRWSWSISRGLSWNFSRVPRTMGLTFSVGQLSSRRKMDFGFRELLWKIMEKYW